MNNLWKNIGTVACERSGNAVYLIEGLPNWSDSVHLPKPKSSMSAAQRLKHGPGALLCRESALFVSMDLKLCSVAVR